MLLAVLMPIPMILGGNLKMPFGPIVYFSSVFAVVIPVFIARGRRELPMLESVAVLFTMIASWILVAFVQMTAFRLLGI